jgi:predicted nucleic acid-binding protein
MGRGGENYVNRFRRINVEDHFLSHSLELGDAIMASTALEYQEIVLTGNEKHYRFIPNIQIQKFKP